MKSSIFQFLKPKAVVALIILILAPLALVKYHWGLSMSVFTAVGIFFHIFNTKLWNVYPFNLMVTVDDFSGTYEGFIEYQYLDEDFKIQKGQLRQVKVISQNAYKISVFTRTFGVNGNSSSTSYNKGMYVEKTEDGQHYRLIFNYENKGSFKNKLDRHIGTEVLKFVRTDQGKFLEGEYFTSRLPHQSRGEISLKYITNKLNYLKLEGYGSLT